MHNQCQASMMKNAISQACTLKRYVRRCNAFWLLPATIYCPRCYSPAQTPLVEDFAGHEAWLARTLLTLLNDVCLLCPGPHSRRPYWLCGLHSSWQCVQITARAVALAAQKVASLFGQNRITSHRMGDSYREAWRVCVWTETNKQIAITMAISKGVGRLPCGKVFTAREDRMIIQVCIDLIPVCIDLILCLFQRLLNPLKKLSQRLLSHLKIFLKDF